MAKQVIYVSATPADYELIQSEGIVVEQVIRPTGLLDPVIEVRPSLNQIDDLMEEIQLRIEKRTAYSSLLLLNEWRKSWQNISSIIM